MTSQNDSPQKEVPSKEEMLKQVQNLTFSSTKSGRRAKKAYDDNLKPKSPTQKFSIDSINKWLQNPTVNEKNLRTLSTYLYDTHPTYKLIVRYLALLPMYAWTISIDTSSGDLEKIKKDLVKALQYVDNMNLRFELPKVSLQAYKTDVFYGYEIETKDSYMILPLPHDYCKISSIEDGIYNFKFNFTFFDSHKDELETYPIEFQEKYKQYKSDKNKKSWIELDADKSVCIKTNPETIYPLPMFAGMFPSIYELEDYKQLKKKRAENENYLLLQQRIPMGKEKTDDFLIDLNLAAQFHEQTSENLPDGIEVVTSPMELTAIKTEKSKSDNDLVEEAMREVFNDGGVSQFLFNSDKNTSIGLSKSANTDEAIAFMLLRQFEAWINRKLKYKFPSQKLKFSLLDVTIFNRQEVIDLYLKMAQNGLPVKFELGSLVGLSQLDMINKLTIENDIFKLHDKFIPLQTSHTMSSEDEGGRPTASDDEVSDSTVTNRDNDTDSRKTNG